MPFQRVLNLFFIFYLTYLVSLEEIICQECVITCSLYQIITVDLMLFLSAIWLVQEMGLGKQENQTLSIMVIRNLGTFWTTWLWNKDTGSCNALLFLMTERWWDVNKISSVSTLHLHPMFCLVFSIIITVFVIRCRRPPIGGLPSAIAGGSGVKITADNLNTSHKKIRFRVCDFCQWQQNRVKSHSVNPALISVNGVYEPHRGLI